MGTSTEIKGSTAQKNADEAPECVQGDISTLEKLQVIRLAPDVHRRMKIAAVFRGMTIKALVGVAVTEWLDRNERQAA